MLILVLLLIAAIVAIVVVSINKKKHTTSPTKEDKPPEEDILKGKVYTKKDTMLTASEMQFYEMLSEAFPKMNIQVQQVLYSFVSQKKDYYGQTPRGLFKSVDFLLCSEDFEPLAAIELNDRSHNNEERIKRDEFVSALMDSCKIPFVVFKTSEDLSVSLIKDRIKSVMKTSIFR